jgi:hypothetical protein
MGGGATATPLLSSSKIAPMGLFKDSSPPIELLPEEPAAGRALRRAALQWF